MTPRIAVFEPTASVLRLFHALLKVEGFQTSLYQETFKQLSQIPTPPPHLIIVSDIRGYMPDELHTLYTLRTFPAIRHIPLLICTTGYVDDEILKLLYPTARLSMPFSKQGLINAVHELLHYVPARSGE